jgi:hypothetical protein
MSLSTGWFNPTKFFHDMTTFFTGAVFENMLFA